MRSPGESAEEWNARASAEYHAAWDALRIHRRCLDPISDEEYDSAVDRLEVADCERGNAAIALDRERRTSDRTDKMRAEVDRQIAQE